MEVTHTGRGIGESSLEPSPHAGSVNNALKKSDSHSKKSTHPYEYRIMHYSRKVDIQRCTLNNWSSTCVTTSGIGHAAAGNGTYDKGSQVVLDVVLGMTSLTISR